MGCFGKCGCPKCCDYSEGLPYSTAKLKAPYYECDGLGGEDQGIGGGGGGDDPSYPIDSFEQLSDCCLIASFPLDCAPITFGCSLWAKRTYDFSYKVDFYAAKVSYTDGIEPLDCPCVKGQTKYVDFEGVARVWHLYKHKLTRIEIRTGQMQTKCDGESDPVCRWFVAVTYIACLAETVETTLYTKKTINCDAQFEPGNCSFENSWIEESGTNSDACPFSEYPGGNEMGFCNAIQEYRFSRIKFYDSKPTGDVTITNSDVLPGSCCDSKTGCVALGNICPGIDLSNGRCTATLPAFSEGTRIVFCDNPQLNPDGSAGGSDDPGVSQECPEVITTDESVYYQVKSYTLGGGPGGGGYDYGFNGSYCDGDGKKQQEFRYGLGGDFEITYLCETFFNDCMTGGPTPPSAGLCTTGDTCSDIFGIVFNCPALGQPCGREISDFLCDVATTSYAVGSVCFQAPDVTVELTA